MKGKGKLKVLRYGKGTKDTDKHIVRETHTPDGGTVVLKVKKNEAGDLELSRKLARVLFNKDWGRK
jgi:hypothetical protein